MKDRPFFMSALNVDTSGHRIHEILSAYEGRTETSGDLVCWQMRMMNGNMN